MKAIDAVLNNFADASVHAYKDKDVFCASLFVGGMSLYTVHSASSEKAMWELNGLLVEVGINELVKKFEEDGNAKG